MRTVHWILLGVGALIVVPVAVGLYNQRRHAAGTLPTQPVQTR